MTQALDPRAAELLKLLIERYAHDGVPVGSRTLARALGAELSPATIRNVMADLEELGFVSSPHTSAGRIPTQRGYRYFVDSLLAPEPLSEADLNRITDELVPRDRTATDMLQAVSGLLSRLSSMACVVTVPKRNVAVLRRIEFLSLSGGRVLAILVVNQRDVQNRVLDMGRDYSAQELEQYANIINETFAGRDLFTLRRSLVNELLEAQKCVNQLLHEAASLAERALQNETTEDYVIAGSTNLLGFQELADVGRLRKLFDVLDQKRDLLDIFDQCLSATGVQIFIGRESGYTVLDEYSLVTSPYMVNGQIAGALGVIGPTRMAYRRIVPLVTEAARVLGTGLESR
ncbi:MAG: heat-inducible transcriptional repressor HrcA [Nevskia sp.]|jgi:heat-inducible transcriptional repressor|nr:heat-inducible transcriptional repressor HrcA [Nevskia sp.]MCK9385348.1 heat-inducible transcriptional repressor HrcA [Nevskia sp.]